MSEKETRTKIELSEVKIKDKKMPFIKKMTLDCVTYPEIEMRQFDMMPCTDEDDDRIEVYLGLTVEIKKSDFFKLVQITSTKPNIELAHDWVDRCPCTVTLETRPTQQFLDNVEDRKEFVKLISEMNQKEKEKEKEKKISKIMSDLDKKEKENTI